MFFVLFFVLTVLLWCLVFESEKDTVSIIITASFLTIVEISYIPQITSLVFGTLEMWFIVIITLLIPTLIFIIRNRQTPRDSLYALIDRVNTSRCNLKKLIQSSLFLKFLCVCFVLMVGYIFIYITFQNNFGWDGEAYHSSAAAWYHQNDKITKLPDNIMLEVNTYPKNVEIFSMMISKLNASDRYLESYQLIFFFISVLVIYKIFLFFFKDQRLSLIGSLITLYHSLIIRQLITTYLDAILVFLICFSILFLIRSIHSRFDFKDLLILAISLGYMAQTKRSGLHVVIIIGFVSTLFIFFSGNVDNRFLKFIILALVTTMFGAGWWVKNFLEYANPFHPFAVNLRFVSFPGRKSLGLNIYHIDFSQYQGIKIVLLYLKFLVNVSVLYLAFGYTVIPFFIINSTPQFFVLNA